MRIGELANATGATTKTLRFYEDIGLLPPAARAPNGYRTYEHDAIERVKFVRDAQQTGLSLAEIASILELRDQGDRTCDHVTALLERHLVDLNQQIDALHRARTQLEAMTARARRLDPADCTDPIRCQTIAGNTAEPATEQLGAKGPTRRAHE